MISLQSRNVWIGVAIAAGLQTLAIAWMVWNRVDLLRNGRSMVAEVVPVDPRDLFRGDYVVLGYTFTSTGEIALPAGTRRGDKVYVALKKGEGTKWQVERVAARHSDLDGVGDMVLRGVVQNVSPASAGPTSRTGQIGYGIESYYVPEGTGRILEAKVREERIDAVLAVGADGEVAIKALQVDGKPFVIEPEL